jgi:hypothetical protein
VAPLPWIPDLITPATISVPSGAILLVGTDGLGDPPGDGDGQAGMLRADCLRTPPPPRAFARVLGFSRETSDDDRTLAGIWPRTADREVPG